MLLVEKPLARAGSFNGDPCVAHTGIGTLPDRVLRDRGPETGVAAGTRHSGEIIGAYALTEQSSGSDALAAKTTAVLKDGEWVLNGEKTFITNAGFADLR